MYKITVPPEAYAERKIAYVFPDWLGTSGWAIRTDQLKPGVLDTIRKHYEATEGAKWMMRAGAPDHLAHFKRVRKRAIPLFFTSWVFQDKYRLVVTEEGGDVFFTPVDGDAIRLSTAMLYVPGKPEKKIPPFAIDVDRTKMLCLWPYEMGSSTLGWDDPMVLEANLIQKSRKSKRNARIQKTSSPQKKKTTKKKASKTTKKKAARKTATRKRK